MQRSSGCNQSAFARWLESTIDCPSDVPVSMCTCRDDPSVRHGTPRVLVRTSGTRRERYADTRIVKGYGWSSVGLKSNPQERALAPSDSCCVMHKGLAVLGLSLIGVMTFDLVGAGAATTGPTITSTVSCRTGTTCTATYTIFNTSALSLAFAVLYAYGPTPAGSTVHNFPATIPGNSASTFTVTGIAPSAKTYSIDILVGHTTGQAFTDLPGGGNMPGDPSQTSLSLLAFTGADLGALVIAGAALIGGGWLLVRTSHRRRRGGGVRRLRPGVRSTQ